MEISLPTLQGSFLLLQLSAPQLLFQIPIQAQVHEKILPVPPLSHCYNSQMHFMSLPMALHFTTFCKLCYGNSSAMKKDCCLHLLQRGLYLYNTERSEAALLSWLQNQILLLLKQRHVLQLSAENHTVFNPGEEVLNSTTAASKRIQTQ